jgi:hypothetical protein
MKVAPAVTFVVDQVFEQAAHVEQLLREVAPAPAPSVAGPGDDGPGDDEPGDKE